MKINLCWLSRGNQKPKWEIGEVFECPPDPRAINDLLSLHLPSTDTDAWLFWDSELPLPSVDLLRDLLGQSWDVFHAGLLLGNTGQPEFINYASPTWMLNRDPDPTIAATSWRLSLRASLIRAEVLRQLGGPLPGFETLEAASLELGYRFIRNGIFIRHDPKLLAQSRPKATTTLPVTDQLRFIAAGFGRKWVYWAAFRGLLNRTLPLRKLGTAIKTAKPFLRLSPLPIYTRPHTGSVKDSTQPTVSVLIPTVNRYPYLRTVLNQLRDQTVKPLEIIIVDQTSESARDAGLPEEFKDLPLKWLTMEEAGQCSSRNLGILSAKGKYILFIDDDDEVPDTLIESHLENIARHDCHVSSGVAIEHEMHSIPPGFSFIRTSDVFPTNNTLIRKSILEKSGLFDLAYDHGQRADHDLGMRVYLTGEKMVLEPRISILHHHAPQGGLREHKARVTTRTSSRKSVWLRVLPSPSDIYLSKRYFTDSQVREMLWISVFETFSIEGSIWKKLLKGFISFLALPVSLSRLSKNIKAANDLLEKYPQIPQMTK